MKRIAIFIGLKLVEIGCFFFALYVGSRFSELAWFVVGEKPHSGKYTHYFLDGIWGLCVLLMCLAIPYGLFKLSRFWIKRNWKRSGEIVDNFNS